MVGTIHVACCDEVTKLKQELQARIDKNSADLLTCVDQRARIFLLERVLKTWLSLWRQNYTMVSKDSALIADMKELFPNEEFNQESNLDE